MKAPAVWPVGITFHRLEIFALDTVMTGGTERTIAFMVVLGTEWAVVEDVEIGRLERGMALKAHKTTPVVSAREATIRGRNRLAGNLLVASFTFALGSGD